MEGIIFSPSLLQSRRKISFWQKGQKSPLFWVSYFMAIYFQLLFQILFANKTGYLVLATKEIKATKDWCETKASSLDTVENQFLFSLEDNHSYHSIFWLKISLWFCIFLHLLGRGWSEGGYKDLFSWTQRVPLMSPAANWSPLVSLWFLTSATKPITDIFMEIAAKGHVPY